jgi:uncharacterized membrane protein
MKDYLQLFIRYFLKATIFIVPLVATIYVMVYALRWLDAQLGLSYPGVGFIILSAP